MNRAKGRQVLDCASPLALSIWPALSNSARGLAHFKMLTRRFVQFIIAAACCLIRLPAVGQVAGPPPSSTISQELREFRTYGTVLMVAAHPDDEDRPLLAFLSKSCDFRTGYLSINRGDGGQNEIGPEFDAKLGVIRTQELLAGRRIDGARQFFTRAIDFGYSKSMVESLSIWDHQAVLGDVVRVIRTFRPDVIVTRFAPSRSPATTATITPRPSSPSRRSNLPATQKPIPNKSPRASRRGSRRASSRTAATASPSPAATPIRSRAKPCRPSPLAPARSTRRRASAAGAVAGRAAEISTPASLCLKAHPAPA